MMPLLRMSSNTARYTPFIITQRRGMGTKPPCKNDACDERFGKDWKNKGWKNRGFQETPSELYLPVEKAEQIFAVASHALEAQKERVNLLHAAIKAKNAKLVQKFIDDGEDTSIREEGKFPTYLALENEAYVELRILLRHGAPVSPDTTEEIKILKAAMQKSSPEEQRRMAEVFGLINTKAAKIIASLKN